MIRFTPLEVKVEINGSITTIWPSIIADDHEMVLFDCGHKGAFHFVKEAIAQAGYDIAKLTRVVITHCDQDHVGSLAQCKREFPEIKVMSSVIEEPFINRTATPPKLAKLLEEYDSLEGEVKEKAKARIALLESIEAVEVDQCVNHDDYLDICGGMVIVETPGHSPGHIAIYLVAHKTLIAGDSMIVKDNELSRANPQFTPNPELAYQSTQKLLDYDIETIVCYHGGVVNGNISERLKNL